MGKVLIRVLFIIVLLRAIKTIVDTIIQTTIKILLDTIDIGFIIFLENLKSTFLLSMALPMWMIT